MLKKLISEGLILLLGSRFFEASAYSLRNFIVSEVTLHIAQLHTEFNYLAQIEITLHSYMSVAPPFSRSPLQTCTNF